MPINISDIDRELISRGIDPDTGRALSGAQSTTPQSAIQQPQQQGNISMVPRVGADILAGLGTGAEGMARTTAKLAQAAGVQAPFIQQAAQAQIDPKDLMAKLGVHQPNIGDTLLAGAAQYAPYSFGGEALLGDALGASTLGKLATQGAIGGAFGATQSQNPMLGGVLGAGANVALGGLGAAIPAVAGATRSMLFKAGAPELSQTIGKDLLGSVKDMSNSQAYEMAKANLDATDNQINKLWNAAHDKAAIADAKGKFDDTSYVNAINNKLDTLTDQAEKQSGYRRSNDRARELLANYAQDEHGTFSDVIEHNRALNEDFQNELSPGRQVPFGAVNYAKESLANAVKDNANKSAEAQDFKNAWDTANQATTEKFNTFGTIYKPTGKTETSSFFNYLKREKTSGFSDPSAFVNDYLPQAKGDGTASMQQFATMIGDENTAKNIMKMNFFDKAITNDGINPKSFLSQYNKLSEEQRNYLFSPEQIKQVNVLEKLANTQDMSSGPGAFLWRLSAPSLAGFTIGAAFHHPYLGALLGAAGGKGIASAVSKSPKVQQYMMKYLSGEAGASPTLGRAIQSLGRFTITPLTGRT